MYINAQQWWRTRGIYYHIKYPPRIPPGLTPAQLELYKKSKEKLVIQESHEWLKQTLESLKSS